MVSLSDVTDSVINVQVRLLHAGVASLCIGSTARLPIIGLQPVTGYTTDVSECNTRPAVTFPAVHSLTRTESQLLTHLISGLTLPVS